MPCFSAGTVVLSLGKVAASQENSRQKVDTKANCTSVSVAGLSNAMRMDFEEVLVKADEAYHITQRTYEKTEVSIYV